MITDKGKELLARFMSETGGSWAGALEFGVGETAALATDTSLEFPFIRVPVDYIDYYYDTNDLKWKIAVRATLGNEVSGTLYEVGVFSDEDYPDQQTGHQLLLEYSGEDTVYGVESASVDAANARVGTTGYLISTASTGSVRGFRPGLDLSVYSGNDVINLAYFYTATGGTPTVTLRFESTLSDYYEHTFSPAAGYNIETVDRDTFVTTGTPSWATISSIYVAVDDSADLLLDGIMIEDTITVKDYGMVVREILTPEITKTRFTETEVTFTLDLNF